ncbi:MAG: DUF4293 domain-containing protein [Chlorobi bacterium]|nr:DUF4293 domain-containing protein [Chlorobiota bacterium]
MIQRIQTVYLFIAVVAMGATYFFPLASVYGNADSLVLYTYKIESLVPDSVIALPDYFLWPLLTLTILTIILGIVAIFLYKKRMRQLNIVRFAIIALILMIALFFFYYEKELGVAADGIVGYETGSYLPVVSFIFFILAYRGIIHDEKLIRSADRLR